MPVSYTHLDVYKRQPDTIIERLTGDGDRRFLIAPTWTCDKRRVLGGIDSYLRDHNIYEGDDFQALRFVKY